LTFNPKGKGSSATVGGKLNHSKALPENVSNTSSMASHVDQPKATNVASGTPKSNSNVEVDVVDNVGLVKGVPKGESKPKVTAEAEIDGQKITGTNQSARAPDLADPNKPTLAGDTIQAKVGRESGPNTNMANAHAEVEVIQKARDQGLTQGRDMQITVDGKPVCDYCKSDIRNMADEAGLNRVEVYETATGNTLVWERLPDGTMGRVKVQK
jgi:hypothetical protein